MKIGQGIAIALLLLVGLGVAALMTGSLHNDRTDKILESYSTCLGQGKHLHTCREQTLEMAKKADLHEEVNAGLRERGGLTQECDELAWRPILVAAGIKDRTSPLDIQVSNFYKTRKAQGATHDEAMDLTLVSVFHSKALCLAKKAKPSRDGLYWSSQMARDLREASLRLMGVEKTRSEHFLPAMRLTLKSIIEFNTKAEKEIAITKYLPGADKETRKGMQEDIRKMHAQIKERLEAGDKTRECYKQWNKDGNQAAGLEKLLREVPQCKPYLS